MIRQYKIHTDLDGSNNTVFDMNDGKIRFYQPSDLGITTTTNIWKSDGIGIFGDSQVNHPSLEFKLETFGDNLEENYQIFNEFINAILAQKFVTLEYTTSLGTFYADVKLAHVSKSEGYGFNGTFSEKIVFDTITAWYTYQQLKFSKFENGKFNDNTKIHAHADWQNFNLLMDTKEFVNKNVNERELTTNIYSPDAELLEDSNEKYLRYVSSSTKVQDWFRAYIALNIVNPNFNTVKILPNSQYTFSVYLKGSGTHSIVSYNNWTSPSQASMTVTLTNDWKLYTMTVTSANVIPSNNVQFFIRTQTAGTEINLKNPKLEEGGKATQWLPSKNEGVDVVGRYTYNNTSYVYSTEENIGRFSKWLIEENIFSFVARLTPSKNVENKKYGLRFLNVDANEYSAIVFNLPQVADSIQINTDSNDEYYQAIFNSQAVNMFSALDFQRFRTRLFEKGSMELIGLDSVEMNVKRKVDFV